MKTKVLLIAVAMMIFSGSAWAEDPCKADEDKFCKDIKRGGGRIAACLKSHKDELSQECQDKIAEVKEKAEQVKAACKSDAATICKDIKPGNGRILACLKSNKDKLSDDCRKALEKK